MSRRLIAPLLLPILVLAAALTQAQTKAQDGVFRDCEGCPLMRVLPAGSFKMGVPDSEEDREGVPDKLQGWSKPEHMVTIGRPFAIGMYEVTRAEFGRFVAETGYDAGNSCYILERDPSTNQWGYQERSGKGWRDPGFRQGEDEPAVCIDWDDAKAYVAWLSKKTGRTYRLPSEAEWEYAARAGTTGARYWGDIPEVACGFANVADITAASALNWTLSTMRTFLCSDGYVNTGPVGKFRPNGFGLHDMLGNVYEWVEDCWNDNYVGAPTNGTAWSGGDCTRHPARGGSWISIQWNVRAGGRGWIVSNYRGVSTGFRVAANP